MVANEIVCVYMAMEKIWATIQDNQETLWMVLMGTAGLPSGYCKGLAASGMYQVTLRRRAEAKKPRYWTLSQTVCDSAYYEDSFIVLLDG